MNETPPTTSDLPPACAAALEVALGGQEMTPDVQTHIVSCDRCQEIVAQSAGMNEIVEKEVFHRLTSAFVNGVMTKVAQGAQPVENPASSLRPAAASSPRIYGAVPTRRSWTVPAAAAVALLAAGLAIVAVTRQSQSNADLALKSGDLVDDHGARVQSLKSGQRYTARARSVVALNKDLLRVEAGTAFQVEGESAHAVSLKNGDMYAATQDDPQPLRISLNTFETDLSGGEYFVAQDAGPGPGVVIVFKGLAQVSRSNMAPIALNAGQIYFSNSPAAEGTIGVSEAQAVQPRMVIDPEMRTVYLDRVAGFERELAGIKQQLSAAEKNSPQAQDLQDRARCVEEYLVQHRERLQAMSADRERDIPLQQIRRGLSGRTDPATWKL